MKKKLTFTGQAEIHGQDVEGGLSLLLGFQGLRGKVSVCSELLTEHGGTLGTVILHGIYQGDVSQDHLGDDWILVFHGQINRCLVMIRWFVLRVPALGTVTARVTINPDRSWTFV
jgi:hypothetical protein